MLSDATLEFWHKKAAFGNLDDPIADLLTILMTEPITDQNINVRAVSHFCNVFYLAQAAQTEKCLSS